jgi:poly-gamma-glutamate synthesis protein (capsule biosynthesis protein)
VGAGKNRIEANRPLTIEKNGMRIAILNFCENEWSISEDNSPGANPMDIIDNTNQIKAAKLEHDKVICVIHGGHEYYHLPSPRMQKQYRFYVDNGADVIVGHHTHCIGGCEVYNNVPIIYSLGNFIFTHENKNSMWYDGLIVFLEINQNKKIEFELHPVIQDSKTFKTKLAEIIDKERILAQVNSLSNSIKNIKELNLNWDELITQKEKQYLNVFSPVNFFKTKYVTSVVKKLNIHKLFMNKKHYKVMMNIIRCEAHKDLVIESIKRYLKY